jgi:diguanylate cyclase (GGDEF)-like protein
LVGPPASAPPGASRHFHPSGTGLLNFADPATIIDRFIRVIPTAVWIALAALLGVAAVATSAAVLSGRRARRHLGEARAVATAAMTDPLTGVLNRRGFSEAVERELERARRYRHPVALAFVDVRGLKAVNDSHGHLAGDRLLEEVAHLMRDSARTYDVVARIGGDELAVLLPEQSAGGASALADRIREQIPAHRKLLGFASPWDLTIGTAAFPDDGDDFEQLLLTADRRLYEQRGIYLR